MDKFRVQILLDQIATSSFDLGRLDGYQSYSLNPWFISDLLSARQFIDDFRGSLYHELKDDCFMARFSRIMIDSLETYARYTRGKYDDIEDHVQIIRQIDAFIAEPTSMWSFKKGAN